MTHYSTTPYLKSSEAANPVYGEEGNALGGLLNYYCRKAA